ncbi:Phosphatidylcholine synthase [Geobacillus stearothermophilus]|uniref:CDP-diacylglycerol--serine O-phosphatidyltransferase n=1 Tax=Geobacillus sp. DSP4a TaxID=2508873 RepID=UPI00067AE3A9|nr:CDP-diacylglycerol--serine O-phosphatidyltransferase [Geobacillus sp. DSP4a]AKU25842.1 phosphatidylserine synthase [Geobacillus sp. LC300]KZE92140.1 Phosphatidylcholine synthase [Geobacillus stearothermophilus]NNV00735.1 CDP-diacylglycerol--serine O-phosphatidyltransferase [Geobacillus sp. DSP4a]
MFLSDYLDYTLKKLKANVANILTMTNLSLGGFSVLATLKGQLHMSVLLVFLAAFVDRFDGAVARKMNIESELGKQLDSMSDIVSFGVAPALLMYEALFYEFGAPGAVFTILYIACGAFRLARFNITENNGYFAGLPITAAGVLMTLGYLAIPYFPPQSFMFLALILSFLMVGTFKLKKI